MFEGLPLAAFQFAAVLLFTAPTATLASPFPGVLWNNYSPAPSPEDGPPASAHATRDKKWLPYEVCGILAGYFLTLSIFAVIYFGFAKRRRTQALMAQGVISVEMKQPQAKGVVEELPNSPLSPGGSKRKWFFRQLSSSKDKKNEINTTVIENGLASPTESVDSDFDQSVVSKDRESAQSDMERLYAAVMEHDARKLSAASSSSESSVTLAQDETQDPVPKQRKGAPAPIKIGSEPKKESTISPATKTPSFRAIYPPDMQSPVSQRSQPPPSASLSPSKKSGFPSPRAFVERMSKSSSVSSGTSKLRNLRISGPISNDGDDEERSPLSPRSYNPPTPPTPPQKSNLRPTVTEQEEALDQPQPLPRPAPQRGASHPSNNDPAIQDPKPRTTTAKNSLPLRSPDGDSGPIKFQTTVLERHDPKQRAMRTGGIPMTPATGVPQTPYSPYMPYTPVTPVTPHLVTKKERKMMDKQRKKKVLASDDVAMSEKELWE